MRFHPVSALFLLPVMLLLLELGRRLRVRHKVPSESAAIEGAIFALFGLLLAFTFSGAMTRYDSHRQLLVEETNAIDVAYLRLDLLPPAEQPALRQLFRDYVTSRLGLYERVSNEVSPESEHLQHEIWQRSVAASSAPGAHPDATRLLVPALNAMFDITPSRQATFNMHPPDVVFYLLYAFSCGAAFLAGYTITMQGRNWFYAVALATAVTATIYATLEIEYPRRGFIRLGQTDESLIKLRDSMK
jgi:hypothetical protein